MTVQKFTLVCIAALLVARSASAAEIKVSEVLSNPHWVGLGGESMDDEYRLWQHLRQRLRSDLALRRTSQAQSRRSYRRAQRCDARQSIRTQ